MTRLLDFFNSSEDIKRHAYGRQQPFIIIIIIILVMIMIIIITILEYNFSAGRMVTNDEQRLLTKLSFFWKLKSKSHYGAWKIQTFQTDWNCTKCPNSVTQPLSAWVSHASMSFSYIHSFKLTKFRSFTLVWQQIFCPILHIDCAVHITSSSEFGEKLRFVSGIMPETTLLTWFPGDF